MKLTATRAFFQLSVLGLCLFLPIAASASCSRTILVPVAATGLTIYVKGEKVIGIYADALEELKKDGCSEFHFYPKIKVR